MSAIAMDRDNITDSGSITGGLPSPYTRVEESYHAFRHRDREEKSHHSPAAATELSHFQLNLLNDQIGTLSRELTKVRQEMGGLRMEVDNQSAAREQSNGDLMKTMLEVRQAFTTQADALERELRSTKRTQAVEVEDLRAIVQQNQQTLESELKRLCMSHDSSARLLDVVRNAVDREVSERAAADEAVTSRLREALDAEVQTLVASIAERRAQQEKTDADLKAESQARQEAAAAQDLQQSEALKAATVKLQQEAQAASEVSANEFASVRRALDKEAQERATSEEEVSRTLQHITSTFKAAEDDRHSSNTSLMSQISALKKDLQAAQRELQSNIDSCSETLDARFQRETDQLRKDLLANSNTLQEALQKHALETASTFTKINEIIAEHKSSFSMHQANMDDRFREEKAALSSQEAHMNARFAEEQSAREQLRVALQSSMESMDAKQQSKIGQLASDMTTGHQELRGSMAENKKAAESEQAALRENLQHEASVREKETAVLRDNVDVKLRDLAAHTSGDLQSAQSSLRDLVSKVSMEAQTADSALRDLLMEHKAAVHTNFTEERAARHQERTTLQAALTTLEAKVNSDLAHAASEAQAGIAAVRDVVGKNKAEFDSFQSAAGVRFAEERSALQERGNALQATIDDVDARLRQKMVEVSAEHASFKDSLQQQKVAHDGLQVNMKEQFTQEQVNLKTTREAIRDEIVQMSNQMQAGDSTLRDLVSKVSSESQSGISALRDDLSEQKLAIDANMATANARLAEERAAREQLRSSILASLEALDGKAKDLGTELQRADSALRELVGKQGTHVESQLASMSSRAAENQAGLMAALDACKLTLREDMAQLTASTDAGQKSLEKALKDSLENEGKDRQKDVTAVRSILEEKLGSEVAMVASNVEVAIAGVKGSMSEQRLALERLLSEQKSSFESANHSLQTAIKDVDTQARNDTVQLYNEYAKIQERVGALKTSFDTYAESIKGSIADVQAATDEKCNGLQLNVQNVDAGLKQKLAQVSQESQAGQAAVRDAMSEQRAAMEARQASLSEFLEKECYAREAQHSLLKETLDQVDVKLRGIGTEQRDALQQLEQKVHKVRGDQRERLDAVEAKLQEEVTALLGEHRTLQASLKAQFAEAQSKVDTENASMRAQLNEEKTMRESSFTSFVERVDKVEKRLSSSLAQEVDDREASQAALKQQLQHQESMSRDELKSQMQSEHTRLWDAVNNHTHDMTATHEKKVTIKKDHKSTSNTSDMKGMQGAFGAFGQNGIHALTPNGGSSCIKALGDTPSMSQAALPALAAGPDVSHLGTTPRPGAVTPTPGVVISGPSQSPLHPRSASSGGTSRTPRTAAPTAFGPASVFHAPDNGLTGTRYPSAPRSARPTPVPAATLATSASSSTLHPVSTAKPVASVTTWAAPAPAPSTTPVRVAHPPVSVVTPARAATPGPMAGAFNTAMHMHDSSGMTYSSETVDTTDEIKKISCGPAQFPGSRGKTSMNTSTDSA